MNYDEYIADFEEDLEFPIMVTNEVGRVVDMWLTHSEAKRRGVAKTWQKAYKKYQKRRSI